MHVETYTAKYKGFNQSKVTTLRSFILAFRRHSPGLSVSLATRQLTAEFPWRLRSTQVKNSSGQLDMEGSPSPLTSLCQPQSTGLTCLFLSLSSIFSALDSYPPDFKLWNAAGFLQNEFLAIFIERKLRTTLPSPTVLDGSLVSTWHRRQGLAYFKLCLS